MNWIQTTAGLQMANVIIKYLPRITLCLEHLASASDNVVPKTQQQRQTRKYNNVVKSYKDGKITTLHAKKMFEEISGLKISMATLRKNGCIGK